MFFDVSGGLRNNMGNSDKKPVTLHSVGNFFFTRLAKTECTSVNITHLRMQELSRRSKIGVEKTNTIKSLTGIIFRAVK